MEDPGEPSSWEVAGYDMDWNKADVDRFGLAVSRNDPNILALDKVNRFFDNTFIYPDDYHNLVIFGDYPYRFNISLRQIGSTGSARHIGEVLPEGYGYIRRFVKIKSMSYATIDGSNPALNSEGYINGDNETTHIFAILLNNTGLIGKESQVRDPAYQIIPAKESFMINLTFLSSTMWPDRESCFNISLKSGDVCVSDGSNQRNIDELIIDEVPVYLTNTPKTVKYNVSILYNTTADRKGVNWDASQIYIYFKFKLDYTNPGCACPPPTCQGSRFLNSTLKTPSDHPFDYNYTSNKVTQPQLRDAVVEVAVW
ncbi:MAG: hypothetical protein Q7V05_06035 [Methanoregula sp.]|nr:hypothetical protein [Methanoregula sp.]